MLRQMRRVMILSVCLSETQRADWYSFRLSATDADIRQLDAIPGEELRALALSIEGDNIIPEMIL